VRQLQEESRAISGIRITSTATSVVHVAAHFEDAEDEIVAALALEMTEKSDSAGIVFILGAVEALGLGMSGDIHRWS
jgi:hypothetical protein